MYIPVDGFSQSALFNFQSFLLAVLLFIPAFWEERVALLVLAMVIGSAGSHMPGTLRHFYYIPPPGRRE